MGFTTHVWAKKFFRVFWWNIGHNAYSKVIDKEKNITSLDQTLMNHNWNNYDLVVFGEYKLKT